jgi:hypothetical protein
MCHVSYVTCHMSFVICHVSCVTCQLSYVTCHISRVTCHVSHVTCHLSHVKITQQEQCCKEKVKPKEPEPKEPNTDTKCLSICVNAKFLKNPQHKCCICKKAVSQICHSNIEDPLLDNQQHRIYKNDCTIIKPFVCTMCGKAAISKEALGCHMRAVHSKDLELKKCNACDELFNTDKPIH